MRLRSGSGRSGQGANEVSQHLVGHPDARIGWGKALGSHVNDLPKVEIARRKNPHGAQARPLRPLAEVRLTRVRA